MKDIDLPPRFNIPFASAQVAPFIRDVPDAPPGTPGAASLQLGFPGPDCFTPPTAGGTPPFGQDFNGLLKKVTQWTRWQAAGAPTFYDAGFSTAIGGYPKSALLASTSIDGLVWRSLSDDNVVDPETAGQTAWVPFSRVLLTANATFYVSITGNDTTGNGSIGAPFRTMQKLINVLARFYDWGGFGVTAIRQDSVTAYTDSTVISGKFVGQSGSPLIITASSSANVSVSVNTSEVYKVDSGAFVNITNQKISNSGGNGLYATRGSTMTHSGMDFGTCAQAHILVDRISQALQLGGNNVSGGASSHAAANSNSLCELSGAINFSTIGTAFSSFVTGSTANIQTTGVSFTGNSGSVTGLKFVIDANGIINSGSSGNLNFFPGNLAGTQNNGGRYL